MNLRSYFVILILTGLFIQSPLKAQVDPIDAEALREIVEADWAAQERRRNRTPDETSAVIDVYRRAEQLLDDLRKMPEGPEITSEAAAIGHL